MLRVNNLTGFGGGTQLSATIAYTDHTSSYSSQSTYNFSSQIIGTNPSSTRHVLAAVSFRDASSSTTCDTVTIGGVSATQIGTPATVTTDGYMTYVGFWIALVPTGETATISVSMSATCSFCSVGLYEVDGLRSTTPVDSGADESGTTSLTTTLTEPASGTYVAAGASQGNNITGEDWTSGVTEAYDSVNTIGYSGGCDIHESSGSTLTVTVEYSSANYEGMAAVILQ